jgi:hypothetical protein
MVQRELAAVFRRRQLQRQAMRREHEEVEHAADSASRVPARFSPTVRFVAHFWRLFLKAFVTKV